MTSEEFVAAIRLVVRDASVQDTVKNVSNPPGRRPLAKYVELNQWFLALQPSDREMLRRMMEEVADAAVFGLFCVLDGARAVEPMGQKGDFELRFIKDGKEVILSGPRGDVLHELW